MQRFTPVSVTREIVLVQGEGFEPPRSKTFGLQPSEPANAQPLDTIRRDNARDKPSCWQPSSDP